MLDPTRPVVVARAAVALGLGLLVTGILHLVAPAGFASIVPGWLGSPTAWVVVSGLAELACAAGLVLPPTRRAAGFATAALFVVVFPANIQMAVDAFRGDGSLLVALVRLPLQVPLVLWALHVAVHSSRPRRATSRADGRPQDAPGGGSFHRPR